MTSLPQYPCDCCGTPTPLELLDAKPSNLRLYIAQRTTWQRLCDLIVDRRQVRALRLAADGGADFDRFECEACYGPGFAPGCC
jgi:hypothetical protein